MEIVSLASSSKGNCHILCGDNENIMLDCGVKVSNNLPTFIEYDIKNILVTHAHGDHCNGLREKRNLIASTNVYSNKETLDTLKLHSYQKKEIEVMKPTEIGKEFTAIAVEVPHDAKCYAYFIKHKPSKETLLYLTDTGMASQLTFKGVNHFLVECNYDEEWYTDIQTDDSEYFKYRRLSGGKGHISIQQCLEFLSNNINSKTKTVLLAHISNSYKDYESFGIRVRKEINKPEIVIKTINNHIKSREKVINKL